MNIAELLAFSIRHGASDLQLSAGMPPLLRTDDEIAEIADAGLPAPSDRDIRAMLSDIMNEAQRRQYDAHQECDFSFAAENDAPPPLRLPASASTPFISSAARLPSCAASPPMFQRWNNSAAHRCSENWPDSGHRANRLRKIDHAGGADRSHQPSSWRQRHHHRRYHRIHLSAAAKPDQPTRNQPLCRILRHCLALGPAH